MTVAQFSPQGLYKFTTHELHAQQLITTWMFFALMNQIAGYTLKSIKCLLKCDYNIIVIMLCALK